MLPRYCQSHESPTQLRHPPRPTDGYLRHQDRMFKLFRRRSLPTIDPSIHRSIHRSTKDKLHTLVKQRTLFQLEVACFPFRVRRKRSEGSTFHPEQMNSATKCNVVAKDTPSFVVNRTRPATFDFPNRMQMRYSLGIRCGSWQG